VVRSRSAWAVQATAPCKATMPSAAAVSVPRNRQVLRPLAKMGVCDPVATGSIPITSAVENPLVVLNSAQPSTIQLVFLRIADDALLLSRQPNVSPGQCMRVLPLKRVKSALAAPKISKHAFELQLVGGAPVRLGAADAWACTQWLQLLQPLIKKLVTEEELPGPVKLFPARNPSSANLSPRPGDKSPRAAALNPGRPLSLAPAGVEKPTPLSGLRVEAALPRGWHVNTGQQGLANLRNLSPKPKGGVLRRPEWRSEGR